MRDINLVDLLAISRVHDKDKEDFTVPTDKITYDSEGRMVFPAFFMGANVGEHRLPMNDHALEQVCSRLGTPPADYMRRCRALSPSLLSANLNPWQENLSKKGEWFVRSYKTTARAVMSGVYTKVNNTEVLEAVEEILGGVECKLIRPYLNPDYLITKITVDDKRGGNYAIGATIKNGETGNHTLGVFPFFQRHSCENSIVFEADGWEQRHAHITRGEMMAFLKGRIGEALKTADHILEAITMAEAAQIPDIESVIAGIAKKHRLNEETTGRILTGTEGARSVMGVVNGLSHAAHSTPGLSDEDRFDLEAMAGAFFAEALKKPGAKKIEWMDYQMASSSLAGLAGV